jgi:hypothetical protein
MKAWLLVAADGHAEKGDLRRWVDRGVAYAASLPPRRRDSGQPVDRVSRRIPRKYTHPC